MSDKITQFNKKNTSELLRLAREKLAEELMEMGVRIVPDGGSFSDGEFIMKLKLTVVETASGEDFQEAQFKRMATWYGLSGEDYGRKFISDRREYTICGISPTAKKYPILATRDDGAEFKFPAYYVKELLKNGS